MQKRKVRNAEKHHNYENNIKFSKSNLRIGYHRSNYTDLGTGLESNRSRDIYEAFKICSLNPTLNRQNDGFNLRYLK